MSLNVSCFIFQLWKHLENSKIGLENSWIFFFQKSRNSDLGLEFLDSDSDSVALMNAL